MSEEQARKLIDEGIISFNTPRLCNVSTDTHSDWLVFETRVLRWIRNELNYMIQIYPNFNDMETIGFRCQHDNKLLTSQ